MSSPPWTNVKLRRTNVNPPYWRLLATVLGLQRFWVHWKESTATKSLRSTALWCHLLRYSQSAFPFFRLWLKWMPLQTKIPTTMQHPVCLPTMLQFLRWFNWRRVRYSQSQACCQSDVVKNDEVPYIEQTSDIRERPSWNLFGWIN